jgi:UDP-glucose 4-epimerase
MKVLVIGGAGYIGSHVTRALLDKGHSVTVLDNLSSGCRENLFAGAAFVHGDILNYPALADAMSKGFDGLVHLAALKAAGESMVEPQKYSVHNLTGTINVLNAACATSVKCFVFSSSAAVYGAPAYLPIDEEHTTIPENYYGFTKLEIERILAWYDKLKGIRFAALRYFNAAGYDAQGRVVGLERNPNNLLPLVMEVAAGTRPKLDVYGNDYATRDGTGVRDYVHVSDLAAAHVRALEYVKTKNQSLTVNLGSEKGISVQEILAKARAITGRPIPSQVVGRRPGDPAELYASSKRAKELLGWEAKSSDVGTLIETTWRVYKGASAH